MQQNCRFGNVCYTRFENDSSVLRTFKYQTWRCRPYALAEMTLNDGRSVTRIDGRIWACVLAFNCLCAARWPNHRLLNLKIRWYLEYLRLWVGTMHSFSVKFGTEAYIWFPLASQICPRSLKAGGFGSNKSHNLVKFARLFVHRSSYH